MTNHECRSGLLEFGVNSIRGATPSISWRRRQIREEPRVHARLECSRDVEHDLDLAVAARDHQEILGCVHGLAVISADGPLELYALHGKRAYQIGDVSRQELDFRQNDRDVNASAIEGETDSRVVMVFLVRSQPCNFVANFNPERSEIELRQEHPPFYTATRPPIAIVTPNGKHANEKGNEDGRSGAYGRPCIPIDPAAATKRPAFRYPIDPFHPRILDSVEALPQ